MRSAQKRKGTFLVFSLQVFELLEAAETVIFSLAQQRHARLCRSQARSPHPPAPQLQISWWVLLAGGSPVSSSPQLLARHVGGAPCSPVSPRLFAPSCVPSVAPATGCGWAEPSCSRSRISRRSWAHIGAPAPPLAHTACAHHNLGRLKQHCHAPCTRVACSIRPCLRINEKHAHVHVPPPPQIPRAGSASSLTAGPVFRRTTLF